MGETQIIKLGINLTEDNIHKACLRYEEAKEINEARKNKKIEIYEEETYSKKGYDTGLYLLNKEVKRNFSQFSLNAQDWKGKQAKVLVEYFDPLTSLTWEITGAEKQSNGDWLLKAYIKMGRFWNWGYVFLSDLQKMRTENKGSPKNRFDKLGIQRDVISSNLELDHPDYHTVESYVQKNT